MYADHLKFAAPSWKRPEGPPRIWRVFDGRKKLENGEVPRFIIQEVPEESVDDLVDYMTQNFPREEITCSDLGIAEDPLALREYRTLWRQLIVQGVTVIAFVVNSDPSAKRVIAGANVLYVVTAEDEANKDNITQYQSQSMKIGFQVLGKLAQEVDVLRQYGVDKYLNSSGLVVDPRYRGHGLGEELLRVRDAIGSAYQIPATKTTFTTVAAQVAARRADFEVLIERKFIEMLDEEGKVVFPRLTTGSFQVMGKRIC